LYLPQFSGQVGIIHKKPIVMPTTQVKLWFQSVQDLWRFARRIGAIHIEINTRESSLLCECSPASIVLAADAFGAKPFPFAHHKAAT
jgi:hypothetical protein